MPKDKPKLTPDGLPVVTGDNIRALAELSVLCKDDTASSYMEQFGERLKRENPEIERWIDLMYEEVRLPKEYRRGFVYGALFVYESLRRQLAANKLEKQVKGEITE